MGELILGALGLMLLFEGLLPFISPRSWRDMFARVLQMSDGQIRFIGLMAVVVGLLLLMAWR
jgi:uncharacterized protein YjeT (DUF2065 family)